MDIPRNSLGLCLILLWTAGCASLEGESSGAASGRDWPAHTAPFPVGELLPPTAAHADYKELLHQIDVVRSNGGTFMGRTLGHAVLIADRVAVETALRQSEQTYEQFSRSATATWADRAFGEESNGTVEEDGTFRRLDWWNPEDFEAIEYVRWSHNYEDLPRTRVYLKIVGAPGNKRKVYMRMESD